MKRNILYTALFFLPTSLLALGLGEMKVKSALDQPFLAEIELVDVQSAPLANVKVGLAGPKSYEHLSIVLDKALNFLKFTIKKNKEGHFIVVISSTETISEPYLQLVVDLTWPKGQLYKVYTVLLDPPGYKLVMNTAQSGPTHYIKKISHSPKPVSVRAEASETHDNMYGPTAPNENVWQIAQHYKTADTILPQVVLAIVGKNPDAFNEGNLNRLKVGVKLNIPSVTEILKVPSDLATVEVMAHDKAWNDKAPINHVLQPPYINNQENQRVVEYSKIPPVPRFAASSLPQLITPTELPSLQGQKPFSTEQDATLKAEVSITSAVIDSLKDSNAMLNEQLHLMQTTNKTLQEQLNKREKEISSMRKQLEILTKERQALAAQVSSTASLNNSSSSWWPLWLLLVGGGGAAAAFWHLKRKPEESIQEVQPVIITPVIPPEEPKSDVVKEVKPIEPIVTVVAPEEPDHEVAPLVEETPHDNTLEFESGLYSRPAEVEKEIPVPISEKEEILPEDKSLDTLLDLAKTYISMGDNESAVSSLKEIILHGTQAQKDEAQKLLDNL